MVGGRYVDPEQRRSTRTAVAPAPIPGMGHSHHRAKMVVGHAGHHRGRLPGDAFWHFWSSYRHVAEPGWPAAAAGHPVNDYGRALPDRQTSGLVVGEQKKAVGRLPPAPPPEKLRFKRDFDHVGLKLRVELGHSCLDSCQGFVKGDHLLIFVTA